MFRVHEPTDPSPTWWPDDQTVGFWARRMAHETAISDVEVEYGAVMAVMDALRQAGIEDIGLITERKREPGQIGGK